MDYGILNIDIYLILRILWFKDLHFVEAINMNLFLYDFSHRLNLII